MPAVDDEVTPQAFNDDVVIEALATAARLSRPAAGLSDLQLAEAITAALGRVRPDDLKAILTRLRAAGRLGRMVSER